MLHRKNTYIFLSLILLVASCERNNNGEDPEIILPGLVSSVPEDGAANVDIRTDSIFLDFDADITLVSVERIKLNGKAVPGASTTGIHLDISIPHLEGEANYILHIEPKAIKALKGGVNPDTIRLSFTTGSKPVVSISDSPVVKNATPQLLNLYAYLKEIYGEKTISSAMANVSWNINEAEWVFQHTGRYPAIATFDYIHLESSPSSWIDYSDISLLEDWWDKNGIISACWHWNVPINEGSSEYAFYSSGNSFSPERATENGTWENEIILADLEKLSGYLKLIQERNIPVIWRPLHEAAGNIYEYPGGSAWFWWGTDGGEAYRKLWIFMFEYFEDKGLNNLLWVWTTQTGDDDFYPGDDYVDIVGRDLYNTLSYSSITGEFNDIQARYNTKMVALSELGNVAPISDQWEAGALWSFFMPWYDYERTNNISDADFSNSNHQYADADWWNDAIVKNYVLSRDQLPGLK